MAQRLEQQEAYPLTAMSAEPNQRSTRLLPDWTCIPVDGRHASRENGARQGDPGQG